MLAEPIFFLVVTACLLKLSLLTFNLFFFTGAVFHGNSSLFNGACYIYNINYMFTDFTLTDTDYMLFVNLHILLCLKTQL